MIYNSVLKRKGLTTERLKEFFTSKKDRKKAEEFVNILRGRTQNGTLQTYKDLEYYLAADIAWDGPAIAKEFVPLMLYAQGHLSYSQVAEKLRELGKDTSYLTKVTDDKGTVRLQFDAPKFNEVQLPIIRAYIAVRLATLTNSFADLYPFFKYEPRNLNEFTQLQADIISNRVDVISDQYAYRHTQGQWILYSLLYGQAILFPEKVWDATKEEQPDGSEKTEREGIPYHLPHPSRVFWDKAYPLSSLYHDTSCACKYLGYWDIKRYSEIIGNDKYFNKENLSFGAETIGNLGKSIKENPAYYTRYFNTISLPSAFSAPKMGSASSKDNDRIASIDNFQGEPEDSSVLITASFHKIKPKDYGICDYDKPVWIRVISANDDTVIFAEAVPYTPAIPLLYKVHDGRTKQQGMAHELLPAQDTISNLMAQWLISLKQSLQQFTILNEDLLGPETVKAIQGAGDKLLHKNNVISASFKSYNKQGTTAQDAMAIVKPAVGGDYTQIPALLNQFISLTERLVGISPSETGQASRGEVTAKEAGLMVQGSSAQSQAMINNVDNARGLWKRQILEGMLNFADRESFQWLSDRYSPEVLQSVGVTVTKQTTNGIEVKANLDNLKGDFIFSSRDGADRASDQEKGLALLKIYEVMTQNPATAQTFPPEMQVKFVMRIAELIGAGKIDFMQDAEPLAQMNDEKLVEFATALKNNILEAVQPSLQQLQATDIEAIKELDAVKMLLADVLQQKGDNISNGPIAQPLPVIPAPNPGLVPLAANPGLGPV